MMRTVQATRLKVSRPQRRENISGWHMKAFSSTTIIRNPGLLREVSTHPLQTMTVVPSSGDRRRWISHTAHPFSVLILGTFDVHNSFNTGLRLYWLVNSSTQLERNVIVSSTSKNNVADILNVGHRFITYSSPKLGYKQNESRWGQLSLDRMNVMVWVWYMDDICSLDFSNNHA